MEFKEQNIYQQLIQNTLNETLERSKQNPEVTIFKSIQNQLLFIQEIIFREKRSPSFEERNAVFISSIARNHFEKGNPYGDSLLQINYWFNHIEEVGSR